MAKVVTKQTAKRVCDTISYAREGIEKIKSQKWTKPTGIALGVTASVCETLNFIPGVSLVGGACRMGAAILNTDVSLADIKKEVGELEKHLEISSGAVKDAIEEKLQALKIQIEKPQKELVQNLNEIKVEVQNTANDISKDMHQIEGDLIGVKTIVAHTFKLVADTRYRDGVEKVDAAYENFINGSSDLENTFRSLESFMFELQTVALQSLNPKRVQEYLTTILQGGDKELCRQTFKYLVLSRAKYLQIAVAFYIYQNNVKRVTQEFERFNKDFIEYQQVYGHIVGPNVEFGTPPSLKLVESCQLQSGIVPAITNSSTKDGSCIQDERTRKYSGK